MPRRVRHRPVRLRGGAHKLQRTSTTSGIAPMMNIAAYLVLGLFAGVLSGLIGIGRGIVIVPALVFLFGMSQQQAEGPTLAMLVPPIGIFAAWAYYRQGFVDVRIAALIAVGFIAGSLLGARFATSI